MTHDEVVKLLMAINSYDEKVEPSEATILAWEESANRSGWTYLEALDAVHDHFASTTVKLRQGHVTQAIFESRNRQEPYPRRYDPEQDNDRRQLASPLHVARCMAWVKADMLRKKAKKHPSGDVVRYADTAKVDLFAITSPEFLRAMDSEHWARELERSPDYDPDRHIDVGAIDPRRAVIEMTGLVAEELPKPPPPPQPRGDLDPLGVECPYCKAKIAFFCVGHRGERLTKTKYHDSRIQAAKAAKADA